MPAYRIGHGFDLHRLEALPPEGEGRPFVLGGVPIEHTAGPVGHSDGDALLHAVTDALLGAIGAPDIGQLFPDDDPRHDGQDSGVFVREAVRRVAARGLRIENIDATVICQRPKIGPHATAICERIAELAECSVDRVNVKGKTHEGVDAVGEGRAIEVHVVTLLTPADDRAKDGSC
ncbi:MAG: 2-C-methyl-D-erythritol 2,4-cyclodiphosphate synthase [Phycisphaerales bacterium]|jgi:2-C-methyl-D-erythritol 2,4-cyclodiphosphate synthase|nr:2-C-methyl-D-erythritol 2,4-cyclodiphosphate synthase [Phycisphaerales bacterium]